jgi:hypothetical protein
MSIPFLTLMRLNTVVKRSRGKKATAAPAVKKEAGTVRVKKEPVSPARTAGTKRGYDESIGGDESDGSPSIEVFDGNSGPAKPPALAARRSTRQSAPKGPKKARTELDLTDGYDVLCAQFNIISEAFNKISEVFSKQVD